ncbi:hypothetical protein BUE93_05790 [Chromobacterium amazonense]|uniref:NlpC/P60 domain-containing protein n=1 Tax=Chromobacterium amazonense TaxID=1382803 RepID=A0A2S9X707_9NEIS|nr:C40 family peptidase [Chromobacterium amazonense]PRP71509.1 hypothetical protein BUE93_05790 [Chromobacterium amazonense]
MHATSEQINHMLALADAAGLHEACGVVLDSGRVYPCRNRSLLPAEYFELDPVDYAAAEQLGRVAGIWHSHPHGSAEPSWVDRAMCERTRLPWHIVSPGGGDYRYLEPSGWQAPLLGRPYCYGVFDCWELVRDWYRQERGMVLSRPPAAGEAGWSERGCNVIHDAATAMGFARHDGEPQAGDLAVFQMQSAVPNHLAVWLGDGRILHHLRDRPSETHVYGGYWARCMTGFWRYQG